jgi:hypothetical protein
MIISSLELREYIASVQARPSQLVIAMTRLERAAVEIDRLNQLLLNRDSRIAELERQLADAHDEIRVQGETE